MNALNQKSQSLSPVGGSSAQSLSPVGGSSAPIYDHHDFGGAWDLFHFDPSSPGMVFWHPKGWRMMRALEEYSRELYEEHLYEEVRSPQLLDQSLWVQSGHWEKYRQNMFVVKSEGDEDLNSVQGDGNSKMYALKPMSCPGHISIFKSQRRSYRDLPYRLFEFGVVHRNEPSGALNGLLRLRSFVQDDSHIFSELKDIQPEVGNFIEMVQKAYALFGFSIDSYRIALRPEVRAGSDEDWDKAEGALKVACQNMGLSFEEAPGEGAFYGPKLEVSLKDRLGRAWQCGVLQVDFVLPERFDLEYMGQDGKNHRPVMLHQAVFGSLERWSAIVLEHFGYDLPFWLSPMPLALLPIDDSDEVQDFIKGLQKNLRKAKIAFEVLGAEKMLKQRVKDAFEQHIPWVVVVGKKEAAQGLVALRARDGYSVSLSIDKFLEKISVAMKNRDKKLNI